MKINKFLKLGILFFIFSACSSPKPDQKEIAYPVNVTIAQKKDALIYIDNIGHVESITSVDIQSRVEGELVEVHFKEGDEVKTGDLLFVIDPRPYKNKLENAIGVLDETLANLYIAKDRFKRNKDLIKDEYISQLDFEALATEVTKNQALVKQNQASVDNAKLNLEYCYIYAPIDGKTGILQIDKGNMIYPNDQKPIVSINQISPIYITFYAAEKDLIKIQASSKKNELKLRVAFEDLENNYIEGDLNMIDNTVDSQTGLVKLKATFSNAEKSLWPGQFVKTRLILKKEKDMIIIPFKAVQMTTKGPIAFVINDGNEAEVRYLKIGQREDENVIVLDGIKENEKVVIDGQLNLADKTKVNIKNS